MNFVGRHRELDLLANHLRQVTEGGTDEKGRALLLRGRRRVGKSRLVEVFCEQSGVPFAFFTAVGGAKPADERRAFARAVAEESTLPDREKLTDVDLATWEAALRQLAEALPADTPSIVVLDEVPYLIAADPAMEGALQKAWDRYLSRKPVLLILIGSDLAMMEALSDYTRPFHQRAAEMVLGPLSPSEVAAMLDLPPAAALDAFLVTGGLPLVCRSWPAGATAEQFLLKALADPTSALIVSGERILAAEFPSSSQARRVISAIGGTGERVFSAIGRAAGSNANAMPSATLAQALATLTSSRVVAVDMPLSTKPARSLKRYRIADPYLRFWLSFVEPSLSFVERGRVDLAMRRWRAGWTSWRGRAIEPVVREALNRLLPDEAWPDVTAVGSWWPRNNTPELDLVGADQGPTARRVFFVGSIKWHEQEPFGKRGWSALAAAASAVPGATANTSLVVVSRQGSTVDGPDSVWSPGDLLTAWR